MLDIFMFWWFHDNVFNGGVVCIQQAFLDGADLDGLSFIWSRVAALISWVVLFNQCYRFQHIILHFRIY